MICNNPDCTNETHNPKYCSMRCAGIMNSKARERKNSAPIRFCADCGTALISRHFRCTECREIHEDRTLNYTVGQLRNYYKDRSLLALAAKIRGYGITIYDRSAKIRQCIICGYDRHVEICHIRPINTYPDDATMAEIHSIDNLVALCPNHHWEFDKGLVTLDP